MPWWRFLFWNAAGGIVWVVVVSVVAYQFGRAAAEVFNHYGVIDAIVVVVVLVIPFVGFRIWKKGVLEKTLTTVHHRTSSRKRFRPTPEVSEFRSLFQYDSPIANTTEGDDFVARRTVLVCDSCGKEVGENKGGALRVTFTDARRGSKVADLCDPCAAGMPGRAAARRGRRPKLAAKA